MGIIHPTLAKSKYCAMNGEERWLRGQQAASVRLRPASLFSKPLMLSWVIPARATTKDLGGKKTITFRIRNGPKPRNIHWLRQKRKNKKLLHVYVCVCVCACVRACIASRITGLRTASFSDEMLESRFSAGPRQWHWTDSPLVPTTVLLECSPLLQEGANNRCWSRSAFTSPSWLEFLVTFLSFLRHQMQPSSISSEFKTIPQFPKAAFLNRRAADRYRVLAPIIPGRERFSWNLSF